MTMLTRSATLLLVSAMMFGAIGACAEDPRPGTPATTMAPIYDRFAEVTEDVVSWKYAPASDHDMMNELDACGRTSLAVDGVPSEIDSIGAPAYGSGSDAGSGSGSGSGTPEACADKCRRLGAGCTAACDELATGPSAHIVPACKEACNLMITQCIGACSQLP